MVGGEAKQDKNQPHNKISVDPACGHSVYCGQAVDDIIHGLVTQKTMDGVILEVMVAVGGHEGHLRITVTSEVVGHGGVHNMSGDL